MMVWQRQQTDALMALPRALAEIATALREHIYQPERRPMYVRYSTGESLEGSGYIDRATGWVHLIVKEPQHGDQELALPPTSVANVRWLA